MKKIILFALLPCIVACGKQNTAPEEYFSFDADGVHYEYPQEKGVSFIGNWKTLGAGSDGTTRYGIGAYSTKKATAGGGIEISFTGANIPTSDTIILDGGVNTASIVDFQQQGNSYSLKYPLTGKVIFSQRNSAKLVGTFEFDAYQYIPDPNNMDNVILTGEVIHITNGKFSIIPSN